MMNVMHLQDLLKKGHTHSRRSARLIGLSEKQRHQIAVALSYSVLQFYDSPWINDFWGEEDIYFFTSTNHFQRLEISDPCFSRSFPKLQGPVDSYHHLLAHFIDIHIPNKPLFALCIILLELCLDMTFNELHEVSSVDNSQRSALEKYQIVDENIDLAFEKWGETFGQVLQRCRNPEFGLRNSEKRMDYDKFRCHVYEGIVVPLEEDLKRFS
jgi:hypothetical protein